VNSLGSSGGDNGEGATATRLQRFLLWERQSKAVVCVCEGPEAGQPASARQALLACMWVFGPWMFRSARTAGWLIDL